MARTCTEDEEEEETHLLSHHNQDQEEEEEEALSLCDLPLNLSNEKVQFPRQSNEKEEDFEFETGSSFRVGSESNEAVPEMSTAEELFSEGRILPLRHSVSLDAGLSGSNRFSTVELRRTEIESDRKIRNYFMDYSKPSPQPQIRRSSSMTARVNTIKNPSIWDLLRLGLVRTPEIELRTAGVAEVSRNSSWSSTSTSSNSNSKNWRRGFSLFGDCKSSVATETVVPVKSRNETEEKQRKKKKKKKKTEKTAVARKRTFEWLKELSQVG